MSHPLNENKRKGKIAEKIAHDWLQKRNFHIGHWNEGKASRLPYDIICYKGKDGYAIDVKSGKKPTINLLSFHNLLNKKIKDIREEIRKEHLKAINKIGYIFVLMRKKK